MTIKGLEFVRTCSACPEQYDVYDADKNLVGYIRLRWGSLSCDYPDYGGEEIYHTSIDNAWAGCFESEEQRMFHLEAIADEILKRINMPDERKMNALLLVETQLEYGYLDLDSHDEDELEIIKEALKLWKSVNGIGTDEE